MLPKFAEILIPCTTTANGNCLWNMISLTLIGNESLSKLLRLLTVLSMLTMKQSFIKLITQQYESTNTLNASSLACANFQEYVKVALTDKEWGCSYHLIALATVLGKHIYVYSSFKKKNKFQLNKNISLECLDKHFKDSITGDSKIGHHLRYDPLINNVFPKANENCLYGFFSFGGPTVAPHYTALIPKFKQDPTKFRPLNCFTNL